MGTNVKKQKRWYWWVGLIGLFLFTGIPWAILKSFLDLIEGYPRHAIAELLYLILYWLQLIFVTIPSTIQNNFFYGLGMVVGLLGFVVFCVWLLKIGTKKT